MKKNYTEQISADLEIRLREIGLDLKGCPTVGQTLDWLFNKYEVGVSIKPVFLGTTDDGFVWDYEIYSPLHHEKEDCFEEFDRCAWFAITAAIDMIEQDKKDRES